MGSARPWLLGGLAALAMHAATTNAFAQSDYDKQSDGQFTGLALITDDPNWHLQFQRPSTPAIDGRDHFKAGESGTLALIFSNAEPRQGNVKIVCDVIAFDPQGSRKIVDAGPCYEGPYAGPNILHPTLLDLNFTIGPNDPKGLAGFRIVLRDAYSDRKVELAVAFTQGEGQ